mgnify:CR=1 FL=1
MTETIFAGKMPILALRGLCVFPEQTVHFEVGRGKSIKALEAAMQGDQNLLLIPQKDLLVDDPTLKDLYAVGCIAKVKQVLKTQGENLRILVTGISRGRITDTEYTIYECPHTPKPDTALPHTENPDMDTPDTVSPCTEKPAELNIDQENKKQSSTDLSNPDPSIPEPPSNRQGDGCDAMGYEAARELVLENLEYDILLERYDRERLDEIVDLMVETLCSRKKTIVVAGDEYPAQLVRDKLLKLTPMHIDYAFECMGKNTTYIRNIKKYLLAVLFNAPSTIDHYYAAQVNHDLYGS